MSGGPFRFFWAEVVRRPCPVCQHPTAVGFDQNDPGAAAREPTPCVLCVRAEMDNEIQFSRGTLGYPLTEQGPCAKCGAPHRLYGPEGRKFCDPCIEVSGISTLDKVPAIPAREYQVPLKPHEIAIPAPREPERENEPFLTSSDHLRFCNRKCQTRPG